MRVYGSVSRSALNYNLQIVRSHARDSKVMAVIKADAYGHGLRSVAMCLAPSVDAFAVATVEEAVDLRRSEINVPICILSGFYRPEHVSIIQQYDLQVVVYCNEQVELLRNFSSGQRVAVWLKINTGMGRLGFPIESVPEVLAGIQSVPMVGTVRLMSHFASADDLQSNFTDIQLERFMRCVEPYDMERSIANSAAILNTPDSHLDWVRPGLMLYGASPFPESTGPQLGLRPVMNLYSDIVAINSIDVGESVGYGQTWVSSKNSTVGIVACGYGDGFTRRISRPATLRVKGKLVPVVGRVSMDSLAIDLTGHSDVHVGDPVQLYGDGLPVEAIAAATGTIPYEVLTAASNKRIRLTVVDDEQDRIIS